MRNISICPESIVAHWNSVHQRKSTPMSFVSLMHSITEVKTPTEGRFDAESLQFTPRLEVIVIVLAVDYFSRMHGKFFCLLQ